MALKCYPLQPGGLLAIEAVVIGMTSPEAVYHESVANFEVILLLMFMVAGIYFMRDLLLFTFTKILLSIKSKALLSFLFSITAAFLSAFLDALTVTAVLISVAVGFYSVYHRVASGKHFRQEEHDHSHDDEVNLDRRRTGSIPFLFAQPDHARCGRYRARRGLHPRRRTAESFNRRTRWLGFYRILLAHGSNNDANAGGGPDNLRVT